MAQSEPPSGPLKRSGFRLSSARLAAVQALYEMDLSGASADPVLASFMESRWRTVTLRDPDLKSDESTAAKLSKPDPDFLSALVRGVTGNQPKIDSVIQAHLSRDWTVVRLHALLRALLRSATFELLERTDIPGRTVISEYRDLAQAFVEEKESTFAGTVMTQIAHALRADEFA